MLYPHKHLLWIRTQKILITTKYVMIRTRNYYTNTTSNAKGEL